MQAGERLFARPIDFVRGVTRLEDLPHEEWPETAFAGRSNVGKSSLLNALTNRKSLARTSGDPGRTRELNFFDAGGELFLVDLPGYGYARAPKTEVKRWTALTRDYLRGRPTLKRVFLLIDSRHGIKAVDESIMDVLDEAAVSYQLVLTKTRPPYSVELDLGSFPEQRLLRVEALDGDGGILATDEIALNAGGDRFAVRLVGPSGAPAPGAPLVAEARVVTPRSSGMQRMDFYVDEHLAGSLFQAPWRVTLPVPEGARPSYVRVVATLSDGQATEDVVLLDHGIAVEAELDVQLVELFVSARDRSGRPVPNLQESDFEVLEDGESQQIRRFEVFENIPLRVAVLMDTSASMARSLAPAQEAALRFLTALVGPDDRGAVITFNRLARVAAPLTNDHRVLASSLVGLAAQGETALYDSLMYSLYYLAGVTGQRALLVLTDGRDEVSEFDFAETLDFARRSGVAIFTVGLNAGAADGPERARLRALASETGGESIIIRDVSELGEVYAQIERDLRSRYLVAYQSNSRREDDGFRSVEVRSPAAAEVRTMSGYYP